MTKDTSPYIDISYLLKQTLQKHIIYSKLLQKMISYLSVYSFPKLAQGYNNTKTGPKLAQGYNNTKTGASVRLCLNAFKYCYIQ
jgi:hypothetical protein